MLLTKTNIALAAVSLAIACSGFFYLAGGAFERPAPADAMFPDGMYYDFGTLPSGSCASHAFRIVNTASVPLRILSLRRS